MNFWNSLKVSGHFKFKETDFIMSNLTIINQNNQASILIYKKGKGRKRKDSKMKKNIYILI